MTERPNHYHRIIKGQEIQVFDIEAAWGLNDYHNLASAVEYILRAPHKGSMKADVKKAIVHLQNFLELPPKNPCKDYGREMLNAKVPLTTPMIGTTWVPTSIAGGKPVRIYPQGKIIDLRENTAILEMKDGLKVEWGYSFFCPTNRLQSELEDGTWLVSSFGPGPEPDYVPGEMNRGS